jgi:hypothetical protein
MISDCGGRAKFLDQLLWFDERALSPASTATVALALEPLL